MNKKQKIYHAYITRGSKVTAEDIADRFSVTRRAVYQAIDEVTSGATTGVSVQMRVRRKLDAYRRQCCWEVRFKPWFDALGNIRKNEALAAEFGVLVNTMKREGFKTTDIARFTKKDHATIRHHLNKKYEKTKG